MSDMAIVRRWIEHERVGRLRKVLKAKKFSRNMKSWGNGTDPCGCIVGTAYDLHGPMHAGNTRRRYMADSAGMAILEIAKSTDHDTLVSRLRRIIRSEVKKRDAGARPTPY